MKGYLLTDRRRIASVPELDVKDPDLAMDLAEMPASKVDDSIAPYEPPADKPPVEYDIKHIKMHFGEFLRHHSNAKDSTGFLDQFKKLVPGVVGDAGLLVMGNLPVVSFKRDGALVMKRLEAEQPHIVAKYTRMVTKPEFDREAFEKEMPDVHAAYRARSFRLVNAGSGAGLVLPA